MRTWRNWQTRWFQVPVKRFMWVQVPSSAPKNPRSSERGFFYPSRRLGISSAYGCISSPQVYIITRQRVFSATWWYTTLCVGDMQNSVLMIYTPRAWLEYNGSAFVKLARKRQDEEYCRKAKSLILKKRSHLSVDLFFLTLYLNINQNSDAGTKK